MSKQLFNESSYLHMFSDISKVRENAESASEEWSEEDRNMYKRQKRIFTDILQEVDKNHIPWEDSQKYFGHMNYAVLPIAVAVQAAVSIYNPNNVTAQSSPTTTFYEHQNIENFCALIGYGSESSGLMMSGGTLGNTQAILTAKLLKQVSHAVYLNPKTRHLLPFSRQERANLSTKGVAVLMDKLNQQDMLEEILISAKKSECTQFRGKVFKAETAHYSVQDACVKASIPLDDIEKIKVDKNFRMDIENLFEKVEKCIKEGTPIIAVVVIMGTTEEGAVDPLHEVVAFRTRMEEHYGASFYIHLDAAFGGYLKTVITNPDGTLLAYDELDIDMDSSTYAALISMKEADSVVIDPHKMGYVPYGSCVLCYKYKQHLAVLSKQASYVFDHDESNPSLGVSSIEGSRPGAVAAALFAANKLLPLDCSGYGELISGTIKPAQNVVRLMLEDGSFVVNGRYFNITPVTNKIDFNAVLFAINEINGSLKASNNLNQQIFEECHYVGVGSKPELFLASTTLPISSLSKALKPYVEKCGFDTSDLEREPNLHVLRGIMMDPALASEEALEKFWINFKSKITQVVADILNQAAIEEAA